LVITLVVVFRCVSYLFWETYVYALFSYAILFQAIYIVFAVPLHKEYSWTFYRKAGADQEFRRKYRKYLRFQAALKVDFMLSIISTMCFETYSSWEWLLTFNFTVAVMAIIYFNIGRFAFSLERDPLVVVFWSLCPVQLVFFCYGLWHIIYHNKLDVFNDITASNSILFIASAVTGVIVRGVLIILSILAYQNFGQGLKNLEFLQGQTAEEKIPFAFQNPTPREGTEITSGMTVEDVIKNTQIGVGDDSDSDE